MALLLAGTIGDVLNNVFSGFDWSVFTFLGGIQNDFFTFLAKLFTSVGSTTYGILFGLMGVVFCCFRKTRRIGFSLIFAVIIGTILTNFCIKPLVLRVRPYNTLQSNPQFWSWYVGAGRLCESDYCFPSGHTTGNTEISMVLMFCHIRAKKGKVAWIFPLCAFLTGVSRVYLMVHYATDVIGGYIIGCIAAALGYFLAGKVCKFLGRRKIDRMFDLNRKFKKGISRGAAVLAIAIGWLICFGVSSVLVLREGGDGITRCAYAGEYDCQNEAQVSSSKYPAIDGKHYCKIHWKELNKQFEETGTIEDVTKQENVIKEGMPIPNSDLFTFYNDPVMSAFRDNFEADQPVKMRYFKANAADFEITDGAVIRTVFDTLKDVRIADEDTSGTQITDSELVFTFFMADSTQIIISFDSPSQLSYQGKQYFVMNNNEIYNLNIEPETVPETAEETEPETEEEYWEEEYWEEEYWEEEYWEEEW